MLNVDYDSRQLKRERKKKRERWREKKRRPESRAVGQGQYLRSPHHFSGSTEAKNYKKKKPRKGKV